MKSTITITPLSNIKNFAVIDNNLNTVETYDSDMDTLLMEGNDGKRRVSNLMGVSLHNDLIIKDEVKYKILHMLSK